VKDNGAGSRGNDATSLAPYANLLKFSFFNATTWMIALGTPLVLLAGELGASSFEVGLIYAFVFLLLPVQILATSTLPRFGYKKQIIFAWATRGAFLLIPLYLAWLGPAEPRRWMVHVLILSAFGFSLFRTFGSCAIMPLLYAKLPDNVRGRYFSTDQAVIGISGIVTLLLCSLLFRLLPVYEAFKWQYLYAIAGTLLTVYYLARETDPPKPVQVDVKEILTETPTVCLRRSPFRQYLFFMTASALMGTAFVPLTAYYLMIEAGLTMDTILVYTAVQYCGAILGTLLLHHRIDAIGVKPVFRISLLLGAGVSLYWFLLVTGSFAGLVRGLALAYFAFGLSASLWITAHLKYIPRVCEASRQALHVSVHSAVIGIVGGLAPILWGYVVKVPGSNPGVRDDWFALYFVALLLSQLLLLAYVPRLTSQHRERPSIELSANLIRPFRYLGHMVNLVPDRHRGESDEDR
jgi:MFS family permease